MNKEHPPEDRVFETQEEAIAAAIRGASAGDRIVIHSHHCNKWQDWERGGACECQPLEITVGPSA